MGGELDSHEEVRLPFAGPGEIKRREVSWTLTKRLNFLLRSRRDQEEGGELDSHEEVKLPFAGPGEIKRREVVLDPRESPGKIKSREVELGPESWTSFASVVTQQQCCGPCDSAPHSSCVVH